MIYEESRGYPYISSFLLFFNSTESLTISTVDFSPGSCVVYFLTVEEESLPRIRPRKY